MVGNDIIDIKETKRVSNSPNSGWERPGFLEKIFTKEEQAIIRFSNDPFTTVWQLWSMKESAYKVFIQNGGKRFFNPSIIECQLESSSRGQVQIGDLVLKTNTVINSEYIFSTAILENSNLETAIFQLPGNDIQQQSNFTHQRLLTDFAKNKSLNFLDLRIHKSDKGVPIIHYKNKVLNASISLTHHGVFGAYSILKN